MKTKLVRVRSRSAFVGALFWGTISDYVGRRVALSPPGHRARGRPGIRADKARPWAIPSQSPTRRDLFGRRGWRVAETNPECVPLVRAEAPKRIADIAIIERRRVAMRLPQRGQRGVAGAVDSLQQEARQDGDLVPHHLRFAQIN